MFNLIILALAALFFSSRLTLGQLDKSLCSSILYGLILLVVFSVSMALEQMGPHLLPLLSCSWGVALLPIVYLICLKCEQRMQADLVSEEPSSPSSLTTQSAGRFYSMLTLLSTLIIVSGILLSRLGSRMALPAEQGGFGLEAGLIGTLFLALSTSLPELAISFSCIRLGFIKMAVFNVLGSNMFNLLIIFAADTALRNESLLYRVSPSHWNSVTAIALLTGLAVYLLRSKNRWQTVGIALLMLGIYVSVMARCA